MHIAVVTHNVVKGDGQGRANYEIVLYLLRNGHRVTLVSDNVDPYLVQLGAHWVNIPLTLKQYDLTHVAEFVPKANAYLAKHEKDFDVVHGYGYCLSRPHHVNTSQFVHSAWRRNKYHTPNLHRNLYGAYQWTFSFLNAIWEKKAYRAAKQVVAASSTVKAELMREVGLPESQLSVILNGADPTEFHPGTVSRSALKLPEGVPLALFAGDIRIERKNLDTALKALAKAPGVHLAVAGRVEGSPYPALAQSLGIAERVHFLDFRRDIADLMRAADFYLFPSRYEACALVLVEALTSGLPILTARTTGGSEVVTPECGVLLDDPNDIEGMAAGIRHLAASPELRRSMSEVAARRAKSYSWEEIGKAYLATYERVAK